MPLNPFRKWIESSFSAHVHQPCFRIRKRTHYKFKQQTCQLKCIRSINNIQNQGYVYYWGSPPWPIRKHGYFQCVVLPKHPSPKITRLYGTKGFERTNIACYRHCDIDLWLTDAHHRKGRLLTMNRHNRRLNNTWVIKRRLYNESVSWSF